MTDLNNLTEKLELFISQEEEMMRNYLITADRLDSNDELKLRLREFAEGNAKRSKQLMNELQDMK